MLIEDFNNTIDTWIMELEHYSLEKLLTKPDSGSWSLGQVFMHMIAETRYYEVQIESCLARGEDATEEMIDRAKVMFLRNEFPNERIKGDPHIAEQVQQPLNTSQVLREMQELKLRMNVLWEETINQGSTGKAKHPGLGYFSAREWIQYAEMHLRHHFRQKERIVDELNKEK